MTMILGFNLGDVSYISGDTRVTRQYDTFADNVQKIEIIKPKGIFIAAAGGASVASEFVSAIKSGRVSLPINKKRLKNETELIIESYLKKIDELKWQPIEPLKPIILLFQYIINGMVSMSAYYFTFIENNMRVTRINEYIVNPNDYIKIGAIGEKAPVFVDVIPNSSLETLRSPLSGQAPLELYLAVTNEIFKIAESSGVKCIGGKTTTLVTYKVDENKFNYRGIKGYKSIIHSENDYQDVSSYTDLDIDSGIFYIRDMRKEGRIVTNLVFENGEYKFYYDSCPPDFGEDDVYYTLFSRRFNIGENMDPEIVALEL